MSLWGSKAHIFTAGINLTKIDAYANKCLLEIKTNDINSLYKKIADEIGFGVLQLTYIDKCNGFHIVVVYSGDFSETFIKGRILSAWNDATNGELSKYTRHVKSFFDNDCLRYLHECACGVHSLVPGDSQVLAQVVEPLQAPYFSEPGYDFLQVLSRSISSAVTKVKSETAFCNGNVSIERCLVEQIPKDTGKRVLLLGLGRSGRLVAKIISDECNLQLSVINRNQDVNEKIAKRYGSIQFISPSDNAKIKKATSLIVALPNNPETIHIPKEIIGHTNDGIVIYDISSPSIAKSLGLAGVTTIEHIVQRSDQVKRIRLKSLPDVNRIVDNAIASFEKTRLPNLSSGTLTISNENSMLTDEAIKMIEVRSFLYSNIRGYLSKKGYLEVVTPYVVKVSSDPAKVDNGSAFALDWPDGPVVYLRQSNQLYKQMVIASGEEKIFEIGPFWRKEENDSYRHLLESSGLDVEISHPKDLKEIYDLAYSMIYVFFNKVNLAFKAENTLRLPTPAKVPILSYDEAISLLNGISFQISYGDDIGIFGETKLAEVVKAKYKYDAFIIKDYPDTIKKFYTKRKPRGKTQTFDIIVGGWELVSGAIRNTDVKQMEEAIRLSGLSVKDYEFYLSAINGAVEHGGFCLGLDRLIAKSLAIDSVAKTTAFPRTFKSIIP